MGLDGEDADRIAAALDELERQGPKLGPRDATESFSSAETRPTIGAAGTNATSPLRIGCTTTT